YPRRAARQAEVARPGEPRIAKPAKVDRGQPGDQALCPCSDVRCVGAPPMHSPRSAALAELFIVAPAAGRSGTSRRKQERMKAMPGTAVRKTGCSASL